MSRIFPIRSGRSNEDVFFEYYPQLMKWALQLSNLDRTNADDLVQDYYLQIAHINVVLAEIDRIEPYLFTILRNLHYSRLRRQAKDSVQELSIVDFDSLEQGIAAIDRHALGFVHSNLKTICEYACQRKSSSRAACIFILRFFLGYYPSEVMKIAHITRMSVDRALQIARREVRSYLEAAGAGSTATRHEGLSPNTRFSDSHALFLELRQVIFTSREGECFPHSLLKQHYAAESPERFSAPRLAHLVSCKVCLDRVNAILGLAPLEDRSPDDTIGRDNPPGAGKIAGFSQTRGKKPEVDAKKRRALERRKRAFFEHRPASLELFIDGETRAIQRVTAEVSELKLTLSRAERPDFVEVFSEQGVRLAYLHAVEPTSSPDLRLREHVILSDGRSLSLTLSFANGLSTLNVVYLDPVFAQPTDLEFIQEAPLYVMPSAAVDGAPAAPSGLRLLDQMRQMVSRLKGNHFPDSLPSLNSLLASATAVALCAPLIVFLATRHTPKVTATALLHQAKQSEALALRSAQAEVIYQKVRISGQAHVVDRAIYRDPQEKRRPKPQHLTAADESLKEQLDLAGVNWNMPLSAESYQEWHDSLPSRKDDVVRHGDHLLTLVTSPDTDGPVIQESLTIRESDFHPVERSIQLRGSGEIEIAELNYDVMPWNAQSQNWFEPLVTTLSTDPARPRPLVLPKALTDSELDLAELNTRGALNQLNADTGEQILVSRSATGILVNGFVDTNQRKAQLVSRLLQIPHVRPSLLSVEELGNRSHGAPAGVTRPLKAYSVQASTSPLERYLRDRQLPPETLGAISQQLLNNSIRIHRAAAHYAELRANFGDGAQLPVDQRNALGALTTKYLGIIRLGVEANRSSLLSIGLMDATDGDHPDQAGDGWESEVHHYGDLCQQLLTGDADASGSATTIARELATSGSLINAGSANIQTLAARTHN